MAESAQERRSASRLDKAFPVFVTTPQGIFRGVARNISSGGMFIETRDLQPMGGRVTICFSDDRSGVELAVVSEVRYQCVLEYVGKAGRTALRGVGVRFINLEPGFDPADPEPPPASAMH